MLNITCGKSDDDRPVVLIETRDIGDPLVLMRALKANFPELWQLVHLELVAPNGVNGTTPRNRIIDGS